MAPDLSTLHRQAVELIDVGRPAEAVALARQQLNVGGDDGALLAGVVEIDAGEALGDAQLMGEGIARLEQLESRSKLLTAYDRGNGHLALWELAVSQHGSATAFSEYRTELQTARRLFAEVGEDGQLPGRMRCQAYTNLGNSFDRRGRHVEALAAYDAALDVDPTFAMALGNRGITMMHRATAETTHRAALVCEAVAALDAALDRPDEILAETGPAGLDRFRTVRRQVRGTPTHTHDVSPLPDPHFEWCRQHRLFLHASPRCITSDTPVVDRLPVGRMLVEVASRSRHTDLQDALNAVLQDYVATRFLTWCVVEPGTDLRRHAGAVSEYASFADSLTYCRWGVARGLRVTAFAAAVNVLDKIAGVAHMYLRTGQRPNDTYFRAFGFERAKKGSAKRLHPALAAELDAGNPGLTALCDLATELEDPRTPLSGLVRRRHAATHRMVAVHDLLDDESSSDWVERIDASELADALVDQLTRARAALVYLADLINAHEERTAPPHRLPEMPTWPARTERPDG